MAYDLPPPWDPGYALPDNVRDEGLERRGFVTKQMPRGTYDQPNVGTGGYAVPQYVMDEGYGQGTFTTKWEPRGEYDGGKIPYWLNNRPRVLSDKRSGPRGMTRRITVAAPIAVQPYGNGSAVSLSGDLPASYVDYGNRAASMLLARVQRLPQSQRKVVLKKIMDSIDRTLWERTAKFARQNVAAGMHPTQALHAGLSLAMSSGIAAEIVRTGLSRSAPQPRSLLGLGCYGCVAALGALPVASGKRVTTVRSTAAGSSSPVICTGYSWTGASWVRTASGAVDAPGPPGISCPAGVVGRPAGGSTVTVTGTGEQVSGGVYTAPENSHEVLRVGPFDMLMNAKEIRIHPSAITPDQKAFIDENVKRAASAGSAYSGFTAKSITNGTYPFAKFQRPASRTGNADPSAGKMFGLYYTAQANGDYLISYKEYVPSSGILQQIWNGIKQVVAAVVDVVKDAASGLADLACTLLQSPNAQAAGAAAGVAAGAGASTGAAGAAIAQAACYNPPPQDNGAGGGTTGSSSLLPVAIVGGVALVAILLISTSKKKAKTP